MLKKSLSGVAVIDDDPAVLESLKMLLEVAGYPVRTYPSAESFLEDRDASPTCLILDHHMAQMTGLDLVERLRRAGVTVPVLLITGLSSPAIRARAAKLGVEKVLEKPPSEDDLLNFVRTYR
jgi:two-component system, LuxR family, response regulator FixJ